MVDILHYSKLCSFIGRSAHRNNYKICFDPNIRKARQGEKRRRPRATYNYSISIVRDPLDIGGFEKGVCFSALEYTEMRRRCSFTLGTILNVRGSLRIICRQNGYQVAKRYKPPISTSS